MFELTKYWYQKKTHPLLLPTIPFEYLFRGLVTSRRYYYRHQRKTQFPVPIIVIGNITVGGTGKTPMVMALAEMLKAQGKRVGIVSRGVGGSKHKRPHIVSVRDHAHDVGDEALLYAQLNVPIVIGIDRVRAVKKLLEMFDVDIVLSDDGLQHYRMHRDLEIVMVDAARDFGNQRMLPAGPLREPTSRLQRVDYVVYTEGHKAKELSLHFEPKHCHNIYDQRVLSLKDMPRKIHAVAGIGNPERFFAMLTQWDFEVIPHVFKDHYHYRENDLKFNDERPIVMTAKDAVKCQHFRNTKLWSLIVKPVVSATFEKLFLHRVRQLLGEPHE